MDLGQGTRHHRRRRQSPARSAPARLPVRALRVLLSVFWVLAFPAGAEPPPAEAASPLHIVASGNEALDARVRDAFDQALEQPVRLIEAPQPGTDTGSPNADAGVIVSLGPRALAATLETGPAAPVIALFVNSDAFQRLTDDYRGEVSAVFYDPPLARQALLGRLILPSAHRVALLDNIEEDIVAAREMTALSDLQLAPEIFLVDDPTALIPVLNRALEYGDFLLGTPSQRIYNRTTIKHLLLTAYRRNRVLIGPSRAFVRAGALASTYTTLSQFVAQAVAMVRHYRKTGALPPPHFSQSYEIALNTQVARSLNLVLPAEATIKERLVALEHRQSEPQEDAP